LSCDQLWAASLIGRNAVTWRWALSYVHHFTVTRGDIMMSPCDVTWSSLNVNVRYILRCFCLRFVFFLFFGVLLTPSCDIFNLGFVIFPCPTHYRASSVKCRTRYNVHYLHFVAWPAASRFADWSKRLSRDVHHFWPMSGRPWCVHQSIMMNVMWQRFDQSARRIAAGHATNRAGTHQCSRKRLQQLKKRKVTFFDFEKKT